jgi:hypothetical protein
VGYQHNNLGMLTGFGTSRSYYLDATDYDATGQDEGTPVGAYGDQLVQKYAYDQATSRLISGVTDLQTDASGAEGTTSYTHNQAGDVTSIQDAGTTSANHRPAVLRLQRHAGADDCLDRQRHPGPGSDQPQPRRHRRLHQPHPGRLDHRWPGTVLEHFGDARPWLKLTAGRDETQERHVTVRARSVAPRWPGNRVAASRASGTGHRRCMQDAVGLHRTSRDLIQTARRPDQAQSEVTDATRTESGFHTAVKGEAAGQRACRWAGMSGL